MLRAARWAVAALLAVMVIALTFTLGYVANSGGGGAGATDSQRPAERERTTDIPSEIGEIDFEVLNQILDILRRDYVNRDTLDDRALYEAAINGLTGILGDTGTFYVDPVTYQVRGVDIAGTFEGIGATVSQQGNEIVIVEPLPDSPAEAARLQPGDVILAVDGKSTQGWSVDKAVIEIRGPKGTEVTLTVRHPDGSVEDATIVRDEIKLESVTTVPPGGVLRDAQGNEVTDLLYIRISEFTQRTPSELEPLLREAEASGKRGVILDVRSNPGGLLRETVEVADFFLDRGTVLIEVDREEKETVYAARSGGPALRIPVVVLQNRFSASGAEVLAAALRDNGRATIVGEKSFGKGSVNIARPLEDGGALFVTIAHWLTPDGVQIDDVGISPDVEAVLELPYDPRQDVQIHRAIEELRRISVAEEAQPPSAGP